MDDVQQYRGNCHCGANRFEVALPALKSAIACNCSLCFKKGYLWIPSDEGAAIITRGGPETLTTYKSAAIEHKFCLHCGTGLYGTHSVGPLQGQALLNVNSFLGVNTFKLDTTESNSRADEIPSHILPAYEGDLPESMGDGRKLYTGGCHCGNVRIAVASKPLPEVEVKQDNCSICVRVASIGIYPDRSQVAITGREHTTDYKFGQKYNGNPFCKTCSVLCFGNGYGPPQEVVDRLSDAKKEFVKRQLRIQTVNVRTLEDVEWGKIEVKKEDEGTDGYVLPD